MNEQVLDVEAAVFDKEYMNTGWPRGIVGASTLPLTTRES